MRIYSFGIRLVENVTKYSKGQVMALTQVEPYVVDSTANFTVANITANVITANTVTLGSNVSLTANNYVSTSRSLYMNLLFGG